MSFADCAVLVVVTVVNLAVLIYSWAQVARILDLARALTSELMALKNPWVHQYAEQSAQRMQAAMDRAPLHENQQEVYDDDQLG